MNYYSVIIFICIIIVSIHARMQSVGVHGTLMCGDLPLSNTVVKLWDIDTFDPDDVLGCVRTDSQGNFNVSGSEDQITDLDPMFKIYTDCNDFMLYGLVSKPCQRKIRMSIPTSYISTGRTIQKWFDAGILNMEAKQHDEGRKCDIFDICDGVFG